MIKLGTWIKICFCMLVFPTQILAATLTVTSREDSGPGTLRDAILASNASVGTKDTIVFSLANSITIYGSGPMITDPVIIDGGGTQVVGINTSAYIFYIFCNNTVIKNIAVVDSGDGIVIGGNGNTIQGCRLGTDWANTPGRGNTEGVYLTSGCSGNLIGGSAPGQGNVISGNRSYGIASDGGTALKIQGNYIGTTDNGLSALPNASAGIFLINEKQALIGGDRSAGEGNVISGNTSGVGVYLGGAGGLGNTLCGNFIGLNISEDAALPNMLGIQIDRASGNSIGLPVVGKFNVIAGNTGQGLIFQNNSSNNLVQNNYIGLNHLSAAFPNTFGVFLSSGSDHNRIGGNRQTFEKNVISGQSNIGIWVAGNANTVSGNFIGTNLAGNASVPNETGIGVIGSGNCLGGPNVDVNHVYGNLISGNGGGSRFGIYLNDGVGNTVAGNLIGLNAAGTAALPNDYGIYIAGAARGALVGGNTAADRNVLSGNNYGVYLYNSARHRVLGNYFGLNEAGNVIITNNFANVLIQQSSGNQIGGSNPGEGNYICGTTGAGVSFAAAANGNTVTGNRIGVRPDTSGPAGSLLWDVLFASDAHDNWIGEKSTGQGNCLASAGTSIMLDGANTVHNAFFGNTICAFSSSGITLLNHANADKAAPVITYAYMAAVMGSAAPGDCVEVFRAEKPAGQLGGSLSFLGSATADVFGNWYLSVALIPGGAVCALATDSQNNTSPFSINVSVVGTAPTPSNTPTLTATPTVTPTVTLTATTTTTPTSNPSTHTPTTTLTPRLVNLNGHAVLAYPNPGRDRIHFVMNLEAPAEITVLLFNAGGERVAMLKGRLSGPGAELVWNAENTGAGIYLARVLKDGQELKVLKVAVVK